MPKGRGKPTDQQIAAEIKWLKDNKPRVRRASMFGDNHHDAIDAQIEVLERRLSNNRIYDRYGDGPDNVLDQAIEALNWLDGGVEESPSEGWANLVQQ